MRILYYSSNPTLTLNSPSGAGTHMREMITAMRDLGHEVMPVIMGDHINGGGTTSISIPPSTLKNVAKKFIPGIVWRSMKDYKMLKFDKYAETHLKSQIDTFNPDLIYERAAYMQLSGVRSAKAKNCLHYMEINAPFVHEMREFENSSTFWLKHAKAAEKEQIIRPDKVFVVSTILKYYYKQYTPDADKIEVLPNCVNQNVTFADDILKNALAAKHKLHNKKVIGFVGSIFPYHGVDVLIDAMHGVVQENKDAVLMVVGDGAILPDLKKQAAALGLKDHVIFTGSVPHKDVFNYIDLMDIAVMAKSNWYGSPVKIFEYGAMKKAIIAPMTSPVLDVMQRNIDGYPVDSTAEDTCRAIQTLLSDKQLRNKLAQTFHNKVMSNYTWSSAARFILSPLYPAAEVAA